MRIVRQISTVAWLMLSSLIGRLLGIGKYEGISHAEFGRQLEALLSREIADANGELATYHFVELASEIAPWIDTGVDLVKGQSVTTFTCGRVYLSRALNLWSGPAFQFWYRLGKNGNIQRGARNTHSFKTRDENRLYVGGMNPGSWSDKNGALAVPRDVYKKGLGNVSLVILVWKGEVEKGLQQLQLKGDVEGLIAAELDRYKNQLPTPEGWSYLWELGVGEMYRTRRDFEGTNQMCCHTNNDVGILQKELDFALTPSSRLRWQWNVDQLPSIYAEDTLPTHDYLSIAVEFENGRDLTWYWSASLPVEMSYHCPLPNWAHRETHLVIRSGKKNLGDWLQEDRCIYDDYLKAIGEPPLKIVRVWFIAVSIFQHRQGKCEYRNIELRDESRHEKKVLTIL